MTVRRDFVAAGLSAALLLAACAGGGRVEVMSRAPSFHARALALAAVRDGGAGKSGGLVDAVAARLKKAGVRAASLESSDSVLAGSALDLDSATDPSVLAEIRRATSADAVVFLALDEARRHLDITVLAVNTGDPVLRATARPRGQAFASIDDAAAAVVDALSTLALDREPAPDKDEDEIPPP